MGDFVVGIIRTVCFVKMKYYIIAGEASGDLHGSNLIKSLYSEDRSANIRGWGGDLMNDAGAEIVKHYRELAFMGFVEVLKNLPTILQNFKTCKKDILQFAPDALILVDYPGFNLRIAKWAKKNNLKVFYYISPQLWAWNTGRVDIVRKFVDRMFVILPFEKEFYAKHGIEVDFPGHPLIDVIQNYKPATDFFEKNKLIEDKRIIAVLPGSRKQEITRMLDQMLKLSTQFKNLQWVIAGAPSIELEFYQSFLEKYPTVKLVQNQTYDLLSHSYAALVTSGTATLETALFNVPQVVCYSGNGISYWLAKRLVNKDLKYIAMANLIADQRVVTELIQEKFCSKNIENEIEQLLNEATRQKIFDGYNSIKLKLDKAGASENTAKLIYQYLSPQT